MSDYETIKEEAMQEKEDEMMKDNMYAVRKQTPYGRDWEEVMIEKFIKKEISCEDCTGNCMKCPVLRFVEM